MGTGSPCILSSLPLETHTPGGRGAEPVPPQRSPLGVGKGDLVSSVLLQSWLGGLGAVSQCRAWPRRLNTSLGREDLRAWRRSGALRAALTRTGTMEGSAHQRPECGGGALGFIFKAIQTRHVP